MLRPLSSAIAGVLTALVLASPAPVHAYGHADKVPISDVRRAHLFYRSPGSRPDPVLAENVLRVFALRESDPLVDRNLAWVRQSGWQPEFKAIFERAVIWARTTRRKRPDELYRLSHELRTRRNAGGNFSGVLPTNFAPLRRNADTSRPSGRKTNGIAIGGDNGRDRIMPGW